MKLDKIIEIIRNRFYDFDIDELHVHNTSDKEVTYTETDTYYDCVNPSCSEYELFDEIGHGNCKYCQLVTETVEKTRTESTIIPESHVRIIIVKHIGDEKESIIFSTNSDKVYINTYVKTWTTGRNPQWKWKCISQLKEMID